jgi:hypothetical protein
METFLGALTSVALALAAAFACGYGVVTYLLPEAYREYRFLAMPTTGYASLCLVVMVISGNFHMSVRSAVMVASALLLALAIAAYLHRGRKLVDPPWPRLALVGVLLAPTLGIVLWPTFVQGPELYLGSANLDFFQSLMYQEILGRNDLAVFDDYQIPLGTHSLELAAKTWPQTLQARFGGVMFSFLLQTLGGLTPKYALTDATMTFALCVPLSVFFYSRVVMGLSQRAAILAAVLMGISAPISMSFLYELVGQGSGMPVLPLLVTVLYLALREPSPRLIAYCALMMCALIWLYAMMLPFALAPMGLFALYLMARRRLPIGWAFAILGGLAAMMLLSWGGMLDHLAQFYHGLADVSGRLVGTLFFVDFLTELFFIYFLGVTSYTAGNSLFYMGINSIVPGLIAWGIAVVLTAWLVVFLVGALRAWLRETRDADRRAALLCILGAYAAVWVYFTFVKPYGYSAFKMAAWLQFAVVPLLAFGLVHFWGATGLSRRSRALRGAALVTAAAYAATNLLAAFDYGAISFGRNRERGYIVNAFGLGDNPELVTLRDDLAPHIAKGQRVGLLFTDAIQNYWAAYRLTGLAPHMIVAHEQLAEDDSYLPDPMTGDMRDSSGELKKATALRYADVANDYFLLPATTNLNPEIVEQSLPPPVWQDTTYQLQSGKALRDFMFLGRGFYRSGFATGRRPWWEPAGPARWMRDGGEFYIYQAAKPGQPYRIAFTAMVGFGYPSASRTLEFWHDGRKFEEMTLTDVARVVSKPFFPTGGIDRVTVVIREKAQPFARPIGLWHRSFPEDTRNLNLYISSARLVTPDARESGAGAPRHLAGKAILATAARFDGLSAAGWVNACASLGLIVPHDGPRLAITLSVPGNLDFAFPYHVAVVADGVKHDFTADHAGPMTLELDLTGKKAGDIVNLELIPQQSRAIDNAFARRNRPITQSVHLESIDFREAR